MKKIAPFFFCLITLSLFSNTSALTLTIGTAHFYPPFVMKSSKNSLYGFDISLTQHICKQLKVTCKYTPMTFQSLYHAIVNGSIDLAVSSLVITPERKKVIQFSIPYMLSNARLLVDKSLSTKQIDKHFLDNKRIGIERGTVYEQYIENLNPKNAKILYRVSQSGLVRALMKKKIDVTIMDNPSAIWWSINSSNTTKVAGQPFTVGAGIGIAVAEKNKKYLPQINQAILAWQKDGTFEKTYSLYFNPEFHD